MFTVFTKANRLMPASQFQVSPEQIICNDVFLPDEVEHSYNPNHVKMWVIGGAHGRSHCIFASHEQEALDTSADSGFLDWCCADEDDYQYGEDLTPLGNTGEPFNLSDVWMAEVDFKIERDFKLIIKLIRAQEQGRDNLDF